MHLIRSALLMPLAAVAAWAANESSGFPKTSPFVPVSTANAPAEMAAERIEFAGVSTVGEKTDFIFHDKTTRKNHWLAKGETKEGISVLNYDEKREQVVVKLNGAEKVLPLRKGAKTAGALRPVAPMPTGFNVATPAVATLPAVVPASASPTPVEAPANAAPATPQTALQKQETEARMLVSDLLEIGMAQRKAYEEAQRKAGTDNNAANTAPASTPPAASPNQPAR